MKELKILGIVLFFTALVYWGVEPFAHSQMHPHVAPADFDFIKGSKAYEEHKIHEAKEAYEELKDESPKLATSAKDDLDKVSKKSEETKAFWNEIGKIDVASGDAAKGAETFMNAGCIGCHGVKSQGMPAPMDDATASASFGVVPPDLSSAGYLYDAHFLAALIKNPPKALHVGHKFSDTQPHPMTMFYGLGGDINKEIADIVAYLISIAPKKMDNKTVFTNACSRCHSVKYDNLLRHSQTEALTKYMGSNPPDLSIMIRAKSKKYLNTFINDPQKELPGTAMPRVGLNEKSQAQVVSYLEKVGDRKKAERESLGLKIIGFFILLSLVAILWKIKVWREVH